MRRGNEGGKTISFDTRSLIGRIDASSLVQLQPITFELVLFLSGGRREFDFDVMFIVLNSHFLSFYFQVSR